MSRIGLFYGSSTSNTDNIAYEIADLIQVRFGPDSIDIHNVGSSDLSEMLNYSYLILGIPTWDIGELQADWDIKWDELRALDLSGRKVAIFGLGDQYGYPDTFQDAIGILGEEVLTRGGELVGAWSTEGYDFEDSLGLTLDGNAFMGLALDEDNQSDLTPDRLRRWIDQVINEFDLLEKAVPA